MQALLSVLLASLAATSIAALVVDNSHVLDDTPLPLVIWHGLGDSFDGDGIKDVANLAEKVNKGTFVHIIAIDEDANADRSATFWGNITEQVQQVCEEMSNHPILSTSPAIDALGFSQGGVFLRGYIERCNRPPVRNLVTFGSPHNGISEFVPCKPTDWVCKGAMALLSSNTWSNYVQSRLVPAQYYRSTDSATGRPSEQYLQHSNYLADVNNERTVKSASYAANLASLENLVLYMFENDTTLVPKESAWFSEVNSSSMAVTPVRDRQIYTEDWIGLKKLDKKAGLKLRTIPGRHMELDDHVLVAVFEEFYGPIDSSSTSRISIERPLKLEF